MKSDQSLLVPLEPELLQLRLQVAGPVQEAADMCQLLEPELE